MKKCRLLINSRGKTLVDIIIKDIQTNKDIQLKKINDFTYSFEIDDEYLPEIKLYVEELGKTFNVNCEINENDISFASYLCKVTAIENDSPTYYIYINNNIFAIVSSFEIKEFMEKLMKMLDCYDYNKIMK